MLVVMSFNLDLLLFCFYSCAENEFATFHDALIRKQPPTTCNFGKMSIGSFHFLD